MIVSLRSVLDRLRHPRSRADDLAALRARFASQPDRASSDAKRLATQLRESRVALSALLHDTLASDAENPCAGCARGHAPPHGHWDGGHCCGTRTENVFTADEVFSLKLAGTDPARLEPPPGDHAGCAFRGKTGCSLHPADRPNVCVMYVCSDLRQHLKGRADVAPLRKRLHDDFQAFVALRRDPMGAAPIARPTPAVREMEPVQRPRLAKSAPYPSR